MKTDSNVMDAHLKGIDVNRRPNRSRGGCDSAQADAAHADVATGAFAIWFDGDLSLEGLDGPEGLDTDARLVGALRELERLHVEELARLLARAAELRSRACSEEALARAACEASLAATGRAGGGAERDVAAWRTALADELAAGAADGAQHSPALDALLAACRSTAWCEWPNASALASAAVALAPSARTRLALGRAWLEEGAVERASAVFACALREVVDRRTEQALRKALLDARACG